MGYQTCNPGLEVKCVTIKPLPFLTRLLLLTITHCIQVDSSTVICWMHPLVILGVSGLILSLLFYFWRKILLASSVDPDQMPHDVASDLVCTVCLWPFYGCPSKNGSTEGYSFCTSLFLHRCAKNGNYLGHNFELFSCNYQVYIHVLSFS